MKYETTQTVAKVNNNKKKLTRAIKKPDYQIKIKLRN